MAAIPGQPQRRGLALDAVEVRQEGSQRFGQLGILRQQFVTIRHLPGLDRLQVVGDHLVKPRK
jgi:hypothetical protein